MHNFSHKIPLTYPSVQLDSSICATWLLHISNRVNVLPSCTICLNEQHASFMRVTWCIQMYDMTHPYVWHDSDWHFSASYRTCGMTHPHVTWLIHMCDMTPSYGWHDSFICVTWLIHMFNVMTHSYVWHGAFICVTWLIHMCDMTHSHVWHNPFTWITSLVHDPFKYFGASYRI